MPNRYLLSMYRNSIVNRNLTPWEVTKRVWDKKGFHSGYRSHIGLYLAVDRLIKNKNLTDDVVKKLTGCIGSAL